jgi:hypothetical protein
MSLVPLLFQYKRFKKIENNYFVGNIYHLIYSYPKTIMIHFKKIPILGIFVKKLYEQKHIYYFG